MLSVDDWKGTPMGDALIDLAGRLDESGIPPVTIRAIGGFALMERGIRPKDAVTDIDYVGKGFGPEFDRIVDMVGLAHGLGRGWINNDGMLTGITVRDFEYASGPLHFDHAVDVGPISIEVLETRDVLRMKLIAIDTSLMGCEFGGEFTRLKDVPDVIAIADSLHVTDFESVGGDYVNDPRVYEVVDAWRRDGAKGALSVVVGMQADGLREIEAAERDADGLGGVSD